MNRRERAKAETRALTIKTAQTLWKEPGSYNRGTIRDIAKAMEMSTGAVFSNFETKEALWCAAFPGQAVPVDSALTRAASDMRVMLEAAAPILRDSGYPTSADMISALLTSIDGALDDDTDNVLAA